MMIYGASLFLGLFNNLAIFIVLIAVYSYFNGIFDNRKALLRQISIGLSFGIIAIICMQVKIPVYEGVFVDQRNAIVILGGAFGGPLSGLISALFAGVYRVHLGGAGIWGGCLGVTLSAIAGSAIFYNRLKVNTIWKAAVAALGAAIFILPGFLPIVSLQTGWMLLKKMALPYGSAIFIGVFLTGLLLALEEYRYIMKRELSQSEKRYRELFENLIDVSLRTDRDYRITIISPSCERLFGYHPSELIGKLVADYYRFHMTYVMMEELLRKKGSIDNYEVEIRKKDGTYMWVSLNVKPLTDLQGNYDGVEATVRDISQLRKTLAEKKLLEENLRQIQKMESIGTLAGGIAHDFNNSLAGIIGGAELLREDDITTEQRHKYVNLILTTAERASELTKKLLAFSRKGEKVNRPIDILTVINDTIAILRRTIDKKITITAEFLQSGMWVIGDDALLQNVFLNLGINAGHAMPDGGRCTFTVDTTELNEEYCARSPFDIKAGQYLVVTVTDTGCGMTPEIMARIFEPFFTTKETGKGTGLGLAAVYGTIQDHHGAITVYSAVGKGTVFHVYLPLSILSSQQHLPQIQEPCGSGTILLIDDEELVRITASAILSRLGYTTILAENGQNGLLLYRQHRQEIRLVILDMIMPVMGGQETFKKLHESDPALPVIVSSGFVRDEDIQELHRLGATHYIRKPFRSLELAEIVASVLSREGMDTADKR